LVYRRNYTFCTTTKIGYARVSTADQNLVAQIDALKNAGCDEIYEEKKSGVADRQELEKALGYLREGDTLVVTKLDRLGRSLKKLLELVEAFKERGIHFQSLDDGIDTSTSVGNFFFQVIGAFSELERNLIVERTQKGLKAARSRGRLGGRPQLHKDDKKEIAYREVMENEKSIKEIAESLGMSRMTIYRYIEKKRETTNA
jgi:DNA invertase Pin-like site-specific DNA recombinase